jgi:hypothetical protein
MPRQFEITGDDRIIYDEEDDVPEMYFVTEGFVGIGFILFSNGFTRENFHIAKKL